jgi:preprotein translocase subunit SecA
MFDWLTINRWRARADAILARSRKLAATADSRTLAEQIVELRWRAKSGERLSRLLPETFALGIEASRRILGKTHYPVQIMGGMALIEGYIAEMQTGEGKTLTAILPAVLRALPGKGCHVLTANEYLATRDAEEMGKVYRELGLTCGCIEEEMEDDARREAYACDITYSTAAQAGFDFLRDRLKKGAEPSEGLKRPMFEQAQGGTPVQRGLHFALIDEADSILIDEAKTPLIIGLETKDLPAEVSLYRWAAQCARQLKVDEEFLFDRRQRQADLTEAGCRKVILLPKPLVLDQLDTEKIYESVEKALTARHAFERDRDYVITDGEISIVDEGTGRVMEGRKWQDGLHQAIEAKENVKISAQTGSAARITIQALFRRYEFLSGMTGTGRPAKGELRRIYRLPVIVIPTNRPCLRYGLSPRVFIGLDAKWTAVAEAAAEIVKSGRSVLIGTPSVEASVGLSGKLDAIGLPHRVLNAYRHGEEAEIVAQAGQPARITVSTNMAGRGTDILLEQSVRQHGGLHVIATEMHTSARIDRQLVGRSARQGDPGSFQFFLSLEDELLRVMRPEKVERLRRRASADSKGELASRWIRLFQKTQRLLEKLHTKQRKQLLKAEKERLKRYHRLRLDPFLELTD